MSVCPRFDRTTEEWNGVTVRYQAVYRASSSGAHGQSDAIDFYGQAFGINPYLSDDAWSQVQAQKLDFQLGGLADAYKESRPLGIAFLAFTGGAFALPVISAAPVVYFGAQAGFNSVAGSLFTWKTAEALVWSGVVGASSQYAAARFRGESHSQALGEARNGAITGVSGKVSGIVFGGGEAARIIMSEAGGAYASTLAVGGSRQEALISAGASATVGTAAHFIFHKADATSAGSVFGATFVKKLFQESAKGGTKTSIKEVSKSSDHEQVPSRQSNRYPTTPSDQNGNGIPDEVELMRQNDFWK